MEMAVGGSGRRCHEETPAGLAVGWEVWRNLECASWHVTETLSLKTSHKYILPLYAFPITTNPVIRRCYNKKLATEIILEGDSYLTRVRAYASLNNLGSRRLYLKCKRECQSNFICEDPHFILPHSSPKGGRCTFFCYVPMCSCMCLQVTFQVLEMGYSSTPRYDFFLRASYLLFNV